MSEEDPLDLGDEWERWQELDGQLLGSHARSNNPHERQEGRHGVYLCPEADQDCLVRPCENQRSNGGEEALSGWSVLPGRGLEEWPSCINQVREQDCLLSPTTRDLLREL